MNYHENDKTMVGSYSFWGLRSPIVLPATYLRKCYRLRGLSILRDHLYAIPGPKTSITVLLGCFLSMSNVGPNNNHDPQEGRADPALRRMDLAPPLLGPSASTRSTTHNFRGRSALPPKYMSLK